MQSRKHPRVPTKDDSDDDFEGQPSPPKRAKTEHKQEVASLAASPAVSTGATATTAAATAAAKCVQCRVELSAADLEAAAPAATPEGGEIEPGEQVTCRRCMATCATCGEEDNVLFPRSKYPLPRAHAAAGAGAGAGAGSSRQQHAAACRDCQAERDRKDGRPVLVTCTKAECKEAQININDVIPHYQQAHPGFALDELPVGYILCPACPREQALQERQVFLPTVAGRVDRRPLQHTEHKHPRAIFVDRLDEAVSELQRLGRRARADWVNRMRLLLQAGASGASGSTTGAEVPAEENVALEQLLEAMAHVAVSVERLPYSHT